MELQSSVRDARVEYADDVLVVSNSVLERCWRWTGKGFVTVRVKSTVSGHEVLWTHQGNGGYDC